MNRKDFIRSLLAGVAIAPTLFTAKAGADNAADVATLGHIKDGISFRAASVDIQNEIVHLIDRDGWSEGGVIVGRDITIYGVHESHIGQLEVLIQDRSPKTYVICSDMGVLVFDAHMNSFIPSRDFPEDRTTFTIGFTCTAPEMKYHKI